MKTLRVLLVSSLLALSLIGGALPASAHFTEFEIVGFSWNLGDNSTTVQVRFTCDAGENYVINTDVRIKPDYRGIGRRVGTCTGSQQDEFIRSSKNFGQVRFAPAHILATGATYTGGAQHGPSVKDTAIF